MKGFDKLMKHMKSEGETKKQESAELKTHGKSHRSKAARKMAAKCKK